MKIYANNNINFTSRLSGNEYLCYLKYNNYNGKNPDSFVLSKLQQINKPAKDIVVFDIGAGQGRNTIPIAQKGYNVCAFDVNDYGLKSIEIRKHKAKLGNKVHVFKNNILDKLRAYGKFADFAFMSHISQHFTPNELEKVFTNISKNLNKGGSFTMDALVRKDKNYKKYDKLPFIIRIAACNKKMDDFGAASFEHDVIINAAKKAGLKLIEETPFKEKGLSRAYYETQNLWGGFHFGDFLLGIEKRPVQLTWFMFKKK